MNISELKFEYDRVTRMLTCPETNIYVEKIFVNDENQTIFVIRDGEKCINFSSKNTFVRDDDNKVVHSTWEFIEYNVKHISAPKTTCSDSAYLEELTPLLLAMMRDCWGPMGVPVRKIQFQNCLYHFDDSRRLL